ncbi:MAG: inorganic phosphate transporter [Sphingomonadales bacterium]
MTQTRKTVLDKDLKKIDRLEKASRQAGVEAGKLGLGILFLIGIFVFAAMSENVGAGNLFIIVAAVIGGYMALNIGANDVANTMGPAVGSRALTMVGALIIAAIGNAAGAILAGGDVVSTVSKGIIDVAAVGGDADTFIWAMMGALLAAAVWVNVATVIGAPVSTTHSIVGGVMGAGVAAASFSAVNWVVMGKIAASWVISPVLGGIIAATILLLIKFLILFRDDKIEAARRWVPVFVAVMASAFGVYLTMKGFKKIWKPDAATIIGIGVGAFVATLIVVRKAVAKASARLENSRKSVAELFVIPLICATGLLAFAHGANDVANAIGPVAGIVNAVSTGGALGKVAIPGWVLLIGGLGISIGLMLYGPKLIRKVGAKITKLNVARAYAVALSAAITVIIASALGLPVSSTHIAVGGIFGVGFLREALASSRRGGQVVAAAAFANPGPGDGPAIGYAGRKALKKNRKRKLVRRRHVFSIIAAWLVTVPAAAVMGAMFFFMLRGMLYH